MGDSSAQKVDQKKDRSLTAHAFHRLLKWLDEGTNSDGQKYLEMRRRLVAYFDRKNCSAPDELADETLNRVARRLEEENVTDSETPAAKYCYIVARFASWSICAARKRIGCYLMTSGDSRMAITLLNPNVISKRKRERRC